jgi:hypothetical protein
MKSKSEIEKKIELLKLIYFKDSTTEVQQVIIANRINELKWTIGDNSDDSWMFNLQE